MICNNLFKNKYTYLDDLSVINNCYFGLDKMIKYFELIEHFIIQDEIKLIKRYNIGTKILN
ncbi:hypothetical protein CoNPh17_CDS0019 [Staphylococcus phage S-CoN_Ph17]|nr:hypothetical protein CoNPh17_CDS0019 [Staphylococcus phage S-CoN_Ph17]